MDSTNTLVSIIALTVSMISLAISCYFWTKSFRPIVTASLVTTEVDDKKISFNLVLMNSGSIPAKHIKISTDLENIKKYLGSNAPQQRQDKYLACFNESTEIYILQNGCKISCPFGYCQDKDFGFWKYKSIIPIQIKYQGWFGFAYTQNQNLQIIDSESFTGFVYG